MKFLVFAFLFFTFYSGNAQTIFIKEGRVEYERKLNQFKVFEEEEDGDNDWIKELQKTMPRFVNDVYELHFTTKKSD